MYFSAEDGSEYPKRTVKEMYFIYLVLNFLLRIRCIKPIELDEIRTKYNSTGIQSYFRFYNETKKKSKTELDIDFLKSCKTYTLFPKFLRFKLYRKSLQSSDAYKKFQSQLLEEEISSKQKCLNKLRPPQKHLSIFSKFDRVRIQRKVKLLVSEYELKTKTVHYKKLSNIGIDTRLQPCDPNLVVSNYSSVELSSRLKFLLAFGLDFCLPVYKLNFFDFYLCMEKIVYRLKHRNVIGADEFVQFVDRLKTVAKQHYHCFDWKKVFSPFIHEIISQCLSTIRFYPT